MQECIVYGSVMILISRIYSASHDVRLNECTLEIHYHTEHELQFEICYRSSKRNTMLIWS